MKNTKSAKEKAIEDVILSAVELFKENTNELVQNDEKIKELWTACSAQITEDFPKYIHSAMTYYFASQLSSMQAQIMSNANGLMNTQFSLDNITRRIGN